MAIVLITASFWTSHLMQAYSLPLSSIYSIYLSLSSLRNEPFSSSHFNAATFFQRKTKLTALYY